MLDFFDTTSPIRERSTKALIFQVLSDGRPRRISGIQIEFQKRFKLKLTYQALRKAIRVLIEHEVVVPDEDGYRLNRGWLHRVKSAADRILDRSDRLQGTFNVDIESSEYVTFQTESLFEADCLWGELILQVCEKNPGKTLSCLSHFAWWMLINPGRETHLFEKLKDLGISFSLLLTRRSWINSWARKLYAEVGIKQGIAHLPAIDDGIYFNIIDDRVIQVQLSPKTRSFVRAFVEQHDNLYDVSGKAVTKLAHSRLPLTITVFRNAAVAKAILSQYSL